MYTEQNQSFIDRLQWTDDQSFEIDGTTFSVDLSQNRSLRFDTDFQISKNKFYFNSYFEHLDLSRINKIFEVGMFRGGSAGFFYQLLTPEKLVGIDFVKAPIEELETFRKKKDLEMKIRPYYGVDQSNQSDLLEIYRKEFGDDEIDLIVDDASHLFEPSLATFNTLFPKLKRGGYYILEDWSWAHSEGRFQQSDHPWYNKPALSNLLIMLILSLPGSCIKNIIVLPHLAIIESSGGIPQPFSLEKTITNRDKPIHLI